MDLLRTTLLYVVSIMDMVNQLCTKSLIASENTAINERMKIESIMSAVVETLLVDLTTFNKENLLRINKSRQIAHNVFKRNKRLSKRVDRAGGVAISFLEHLNEAAADDPTYV
jgi:hypothetical protein